MKEDIKKSRKDLYAPSAKEFVLVDVPKMKFLMIDGMGDPNVSASYKDAIETLFGLSYAIKFTCKQSLEKDYVVYPLEGLWHADDPADFELQRKDKWKWTAMIGQPDFVTASMLKEAKLKLAKKKAEMNLDLVRMESLSEGKCLQILHIGSYSAEAPILKRLHTQIMPDAGLTFNGKHHEIYLNDARKIVPEKLKTILRQPVAPIK